MPQQEGRNVAVFWVNVAQTPENTYLVTLATRSGDAKQFHIETRAGVTALVDLYLAQWESPVGMVNE